jgi:hypothetical protein
LSLIKAKTYHYHPALKIKKVVNVVGFYFFFDNAKIAKSKAAIATASVPKTTAVKV